MDTPYRPSDHIKNLGHGTELTEQREITVLTYQSSVPFNYSSINEGLDRAWLSPVVSLGVFRRTATERDDEIRVVLGHQGSLSVKVYDYDNRRPLYYSWQNVVVETMSIRYSRDENGMLMFTVQGGGRRITHEKLLEFHELFLGIPPQVVRRLSFDLARVRQLCFGRFGERLYFIRFSNAQSTSYSSIDHASFQGRSFLNPETVRLKEIREDEGATVESFDSAIKVVTTDLRKSIEARFQIRGLAGALHITLPKLYMSWTPATADEEAQVFHRIVDEVVQSILDADYYSRRKLTMAELELNPEFPEIADTTPYKELLRDEQTRAEFIRNLDLGSAPVRWLPHLRALDELMSGEAAAGSVSQALEANLGSDHSRLRQLLGVCRPNPDLVRVGTAVRDLLLRQFHDVPPRQRAFVEEALLLWSLEHETAGWDVDVDSNVVRMGGLTWSTEDLSLEAFCEVLQKVVGAFHQALVSSPLASSDRRETLEKYQWCLESAARLPASALSDHTPLRLVSAGKVPRSLPEGRTLLRRPAGTMRELDQAVLEQFGLGLWPCLRAYSTPGGVQLRNDGFGMAHAARVTLEGARRADRRPARSSDLAPAQAILIPEASSTQNLEVSFEKFGTRHRVCVPIENATSLVQRASRVRLMAPALHRKQQEALREHRRAIDPKGTVVGSSPVFLKVFDEIYYANRARNGEEPGAILLLGERGVGKTHIAKLVHDSSQRAAGPFKEANATGSGGDLNIQRGEWVGFGKGHGISGIDPKGRRGYVQEAAGGTLFVDELALMSSDLQGVFLAILERRSVEAVGGGTVSPNVRCVFATNADLEQAVSEGRLRPDLLDRIRWQIRIPPLRERPGDILPLARHLLDGGLTLTSRASLALLQQTWPGNVRDLSQVVGRAVARASGDSRRSVEFVDLDILAPREITTFEEMTEDEASAQLWKMADEIAHAEGFEHGSGLQRRAGEIVGVGEAQASRSYDQFGLTSA